MASLESSGLNAEAPEFHPSNHVQKLHPPYLTFHPLIHQPSYPFIYYSPTPSKHDFHSSTYFSFRFHTNHRLTTATPSFPPFSGMQKELAVQAAATESNDSKQVLSDGEMTDRGSPTLRIPRLEWRQKGVDVSEKVPELKKESSRKNHHKKYVNIYEQLHSKASIDRKNKGSVFPVVPVRLDGDETTVMIKNIPNNRDMIVKFLENHCMVENAKDQENGEENTFSFDFVYLPIDFRTGLNKGYAFVNFTKPSAAWRFVLTASNQKWELFLSHKIRDVVAARLQGKEKLEKHFGSVNFPCESEEVLPLCFSPPRDGVIKGSQRTLGSLLYKPQ
ncbi:hypothetical protein KIW84_074210 [Lathyrus oleraceus]|uniref:Mei2-like C-terminal RNA recognition motif domain-containing protein n=1 Tax=Pisum sativum TaxID=3888 RepID=A0A9D4ZXQ0_PEA|nr:hypothetical protein KIW84_074210 [Pisum sativum]